MVPSKEVTGTKTRRYVFGATSKGGKCGLAQNALNGGFGGNESNS